MAMRHGGQVLVDQLKIQGVRRVFSIPGESYLPVLDGLYDSGIENVVCRQEGGAAMMAEAHAKLTGSPGVVLVTRGPGATNASAGVHVAFQDSTPLILLIGQVARDQRDREAFQEVDFRAFFSPLAKWVAEVDQAERLPEYLSRAFYMANAGRPGPVVLSLPEDMLNESIDVADAYAMKPLNTHCAAEQAEQIQAHLQHAKRPFVLVGGGGWNAECRAQLQTFAERFALPVGTSFRCQDYFDNRHPCYVGDVGIGINPRLAQQVREADVLLVLGARLGEITTSGYTLLKSPKPQQTLLHVHPDPNELGHVYAPDWASAAHPRDMLAQLASLPALAYCPWAEYTKNAHESYQQWRTPKATPGDLKLERVVAHLSDGLAEDAIICNGAGNYAAWVHRYFQYKGWRTQLAPTCGSMGYGLPAAIAAACEFPERTVVCFAGDGCLQMTLQELGTAVQQRANLILLVCDNQRYGTIRMHQQRHFPGRVSGTELVNPDFTAWAKAYGAYAETVARTEDFPVAFERAEQANGPAVLWLQMDRRALSPSLTLST